MEEQVQKELKELCENIIRDTGPQAILDSLTQVQMLYEKLLVINYLQEAEAKNADTLDFSIDETETVSKAEPEPTPIEDPQEENLSSSTAQQTPVQTQKTPEPEYINESPVPQQELKDDPTPEEQQVHPDRISSEEAHDSGSIKQASLNHRFGTGILRIGLNDRIAFVKHLFGGAQEDFNRVLSQLNTFSSFEEAEDFIESIVKPDYDWSQKQEYELRFRQLVRNRFGNH